MRGPRVSVVEERSGLGVGVRWGKGAVMEAVVWVQAIRDVPQCLEVMLGAAVSMEVIVLVWLVASKGGRVQRLIHHLRLSCC